MDGYQTVPGLAALKLGATEVDFQDYNNEVIIKATAPNVVLNLLATSTTSIPASLIQSQKLQQAKTIEDINARCKFYSGDWELMHELLIPNSSDNSSNNNSNSTSNSNSPRKYDIILSSDTVYQQVAHRKLHDLLEHIMHPKVISSIIILLV